MALSMSNNFYPIMSDFRVIFWPHITLLGKDRTSFRNHPYTELAIFPDFWHPPPPCRQFFSIICRQFWPIFDPSPNCRRHLWTTPYVYSHNSYRFLTYWSKSIEQGDWFVAYLHSIKQQHVPITHFHLKSPSAPSHSLIFSSGQTWINDEHQFGGQDAAQNGLK